MSQFSGRGDNPLQFEATAENSEVSRGVPFTERLTLDAWRLNGGAVIPAAAAGNVGYGAILTSLKGFIWDPAADNTDIIVYSWDAPKEFRQLDAAAGYKPLLLDVFANRWDLTGSATSNEGLAITGTMAWLNPGETAIRTLTTPASVELVAANQDPESFSWLALDLGARLLAEEEELHAEAAVVFKLSVNETVGANQAVHMLGARLRYRRHASFRVRGDRSI